MPAWSGLRCDILHFRRIIVFPRISHVEMLLFCDIIITTDLYKPASSLIDPPPQYLYFRRTLARPCSSPAWSPSSSASVSPSSSSAPSSSTLFVNRFFSSLLYFNLHSALFSRARLYNVKISKPFLFSPIFVCLRV